MWFDKQDLGNRKQIYSLSEKKSNLKNDYVRNRNDLNLKKKYDDFDTYLKGDNSFGQVFVVKDSNFDNNAPKYKKRQVVSLGVKKGYMTAVPIYKNKYVVELSNFDNCRSINLNNLRSISLNNVYEKDQFGSYTSNSTLTKNEKDLIKKKLSGDYHY